ncbi:opine dehydrogenase [Natronincola peptidivorans]|uniref:Opine dehydrogenase n=1 Tax=Natronincola peptidivorans TaxID=426128 RepID=A0A1I0AXX6_9FIRM|nr:NAD/NADP-dependent octopine/nopaline dehydrogenase family protein [Natronincola peptidivorans]SES99077.1 opine dehydrogenase [Natronincola peptidivorans]
MKVAVLGSGNGGCAVAADFALNGHDVYLFDFEEFHENIDAIRKNGGILAEGDFSGFAEIKYAGHDLKKTITGADLIMVVRPAFGTEIFAKAAKDYIEKGQKIVICPGSCGGSLLFKKALGLELEDDSVIVAETSTLPYACRVIEAGKVFTYIKLVGGIYLAAIPSRLTKEVFEVLKGVYPGIVQAKNVLQTTLQNGNPVIHPAVTLLNAALVERKKGDFYFYEEGITPSVGRLMEAVDKERIEIGKRLEIEIVPNPVLGLVQGYMQEGNYDTGYSKGKGFQGIKAQSKLDNRYLNEDVGYGLVFMSELAKQIGVETPIMDSIINIASVIIKKQYREMKSRTPETLGLSKYTVEELINVL